MTDRVRAAEKAGERAVEAMAAEMVAGATAEEKVEAGWAAVMEAGEMAAVVMEAAATVEGRWRRTARARRRG